MAEGTILASFGTGSLIREALDLNQEAVCRGVNAMASLYNIPSSALINA